MTDTTFIEFERAPRRRLGDLNLTPLIDVLFILIIFFMLTTSFMRVESLELVLPSAAGKAVEKKDLVHVFIYANGEMALGRRQVDRDDLSASLARMMERDPNTKIMLFSADGVTMQQLVTVMDRIYAAGGKSLFVRKWESAPAPPPPLPKKPEPAPEPVFAPWRKPSILDLWGE